MLLSKIRLVILCISKLTFTPSTMMVGKIWIFLVVAGLVAAVVSSIQADSGTGMSYKIWVTNKLLNKVN